MLGLAGVLQFCTTIPAEVVNSVDIYSFAYSARPNFQDFHFILYLTLKKCSNVITGHHFRQPEREERNLGGSGARACRVWIEHYAS